MFESVFMTNNPEINQILTRRVGGEAVISLKTISRR